MAGNAAFLKENGIALTPEQEKAMEKLSGEGKTPLLFAAGKALSGIIAVADTVKDSSVTAIRELHDMNIQVVMLTGDNKRTAAAVQKKLGINRVAAEVLPKDKEKEIRRLQQEGRKVAMIGDGINDAPALAAADVGIAIGAGTDVAIDSADIILMKSRLTDAVTAIRLSRAVIRNIKENLFWAFFYNSIGIPLAAGVLYPAFGIRLNPMFGAAAMSLSSLFVVGNALRLRGFKAGERGPAHETEAEDGAAEAWENAETGENLEAGENACPGQEIEKNNKIEEKQEERSMNKTMIIEGMMCAHCTGRVQKALEAVEGVESVVMSLEEKSAVLTLSSQVEDEALKAAVAEAGYEVTQIRS